MPQNQVLSHPALSTPESDSGRDNRRLVIVMVLAAAINYIDRGSLSIAAPAIMAELSLDPKQMGFLLSSFFWTYAPFQIVSAWFIDRRGVRLVLAVGFILWSLATFGVAFASGVTGIFVLRLLLGVGQSAAFPAFSDIIARKFAVHERGFPNAAIDSAVKAGPGLGMLLGGLLVAGLGWRSLFVILGLGGLMWLVPWYRWVRVGSGVTARDQTETGPRTAEILKNRNAWGAFIGNFGANYSYYFLFTWLPLYLVTERHLSMSAMAVASALPFTASAASSLAGGWLSDRWIRRGGSPTQVRKTIVVLGLLGTTVILPAAMVPSLTLSMVLLVLGYISSGLFSSNHWALSQTLAGPAAAGKWTGLQNGFANLAGVVAPYVTGLILARYGSFYYAFLAAAVALLVGVVCYLFVVGRVEEIAWKSNQPA